MDPVVGGVRTGEGKRKNSIMEEEEVVTDNTENRFTVDLLFVKLLLPALRAYVTERIETFFEEHPVLKKPGGYRELGTDPVKKSVDLVHPIVMYPNDDTLPSFNEFSKLYFEKPFFEKLGTCGDVRVFLVLVTKAGCFSNSQAAVAYKLKNQRDALAHQEIISDRMKGEVFENIESLLQTMPDTDKSLEGVEKVKEHGVRSFLPHLRRNSKSQKKTSNKPAQMTSENFFNSNEREKKSFFISTHLHVTFYVNLFCLVLSLVNMSTCNITSPPEIGDLMLGSVDVSENDDVKDDPKNEKGEKELKEAQNMENESTIETNNKTGRRKKDEINDDHSNESHKESDKENCENKSNKKIKTDGSHSEDGLSQDPKSREKHNAEVKRKATNDKASNTWITTMKKETKKARLALRSEQQPTTVERKRETLSNGSGKLTAMEVSNHFSAFGKS